MLGMAIYLGFKDVTLVGCDHLMRPKASEHFYEYGMLDEVNSGFIGQEILASAQKFMKLRVVSPSNIYRGDLIPHIQYDELTGQNPQFKENYEIISKDDLSVLINCNLPYSITEDEFKSMGVNIVIYGIYILDGTKLMPSYQSSGSGSYPSSVSSATSNTFNKQ